MIQHIRVRVGDKQCQRLFSEFCKLADERAAENKPSPWPVTNAVTADAAQSDKPAINNVVFDHLSLAWGIDQNAGVSAHIMDPVTSDTDFTKNMGGNVTFTHSIFAEPLRSYYYQDHPDCKNDNQHDCPVPTKPNLALNPPPRYCFVTQPGTGLLFEYGNNLSSVKNLFISASGRSPCFKGSIGNGALVNNLIYNWGYWGTEVGYGEGDFSYFSGFDINIIGNVYIAGYDSVYTQFPPSNQTSPSTLKSAIVVHKITFPNSVYLYDNLCLQNGLATTTGCGEKSTDSWG